MVVFIVIAEPRCEPREGEAFSIGGKSDVG